MPDKIFQIPASLSAYNGLSGGSVKLVFHTQENLSTEQTKRMIDLHEKTGYLSFNVEAIEAENLLNLPAIKVGDYEGKTPGQRLRSTLYVLWEKKGKPGKTFTDYYIRSMARFQSQVSTQIEECEE